MRNPGTKLRIMHDSKVENAKPLTDKEEKFCDLIIEGRSYVEAAEESGIVPVSSTRKDKAQKAKNLMNRVAAKEYLSENAKTVKLLVPRDYDEVRRHMYEIAMGYAEKECTKVTKDGQIVNYTDTPSFRDQIAASAWLSADLREQKNRLEKIPEDEIVITDIEEIDKKTQDFVDRFSYRPIDTRPVQRIRTLREIQEETEKAEDGDTSLPDDRSNAILREAIDNSLGDYRI